MFQELLEALPDSAWQSIVAGEALLLVDDQHVEIGPASASNAILGSDAEGSDWEALKMESVGQAKDLLANYYLSHALTRPGFDSQARVHLNKVGAESFTAPDGMLPVRTLFVDGGEVVAESSESPRHRYGAYCEVREGLSATARAEAAHRWLDEGDAYERYMSMNVCRYNC